MTFIHYSGATNVMVPASFCYEMWFPLRHWNPNKFSLPVCSTCTKYQCEFVSYILSRHFSEQPSDSEAYLPNNDDKRFSEFLGGKKRFSEFLGGKKRFSEFLGGKKKRFSEFLGGKKRFSEFLGGKKRFSEFLGGKKKRFSEFLGGKKRFSEFLGGKKRFSEFLGGKKRFSEFLGGKRSSRSLPEKRDLDFLGGR